MLVYFPERYKTKRICDKVAEDYQAALKFIPDWIFTSKMHKKLDNTLHANDGIFIHNENFNKVTVIAILAIDIDKINLDKETCT